MITIENYEAYLLQYIEGTLSSEERVEVENFLKQHSDLKEEMESFYDPNLKVTAPKENMPNKQSLKHRLVMPIVWRAVAAACLIGGAVVLGVNIILPQFDTQMIAKVETDNQLKRLNQESVVAFEEDETAISNLDINTKEVKSVGGEIGIKVQPIIETINQNESQVVDVNDNAILKEKKEKDIIQNSLQSTINSNEQLVAINTEAVIEENINEFDNSSINQEVKEIIQDPLQSTINSDEQLIAMNSEEIIDDDKEIINIIKSDNLITIEEPKIVRSNNLINYEIKSLPMIIEEYVAEPLLMQVEKTRIKVVNQLYAVVNEIKNK